MLVDLITARSLEKYHLHLGLRALDPFFNLFNRFQNIVGNQILSKLHMRVDQNLLGREVHRQQLDDSFDIRMTLNRLLMASTSFALAASPRSNPRAARANTKATTASTMPIIIDA